MALGATSYSSVTWTTGDTITEAKLDAMVANDQAYDSHASQGLLLNNNTGFYQKDSGGANRLVANIDGSNILQVGTSDLDSINFNVETSVPQVYTGIINGASTLNTTGNKVVTGLGFKPRLVIFSIMPTSSASGNTTGGGAMNASTQFAYCGASSGTSHSRQKSESACMIVISAGSSTIVMSASYVSIDADGFTFNVGTTAGATFDFSYIAIGG